MNMDGITTLLQNLDDDHEDHRRYGTTTRILKQRERFIGILQKIPLFSGLSIIQFSTLLKSFSKTMFRSGDTVCRLGDESHVMYVLIKGDMTVILPGGSRVLDIQPIGIVGEMGIFTGEKRSADVIAKTDCITLTITRRDFFRLFRNDTDIALKVLMNVIHELAEKVRRDNRIIEDLKHGIKPQGLTDFLND